MMELMGNSSPSDQLIQDVDRVLSRHATDFSSLFAVKPPSPVDRAELRKCSIEGSYMKRFRGKHVIPYTLVDEAIILSNVLQINEFIALDLLTIAEAELDNYPDWPRGLVAVIMFYEGRLWLMQTLCTIIRCSPGHQWTSVFHPSILASFRRVLNLVYNREDVIDNLITLVQRFNVEEHINHLEKNRALGDSRHRRQVKNLLAEITNILTRIIFCYSGQQGLCWPELCKLLDYLKTQINPTVRPVTKGDTILIATILYTVETKLCSSNTNLTHSTIGHALRQYLADNLDENWKCRGFYKLLRLALIVTAHKLASDDMMKTEFTGSNLETSTTESASMSLELEKLVNLILKDDSEDKHNMHKSYDLFDFLKREVFSVPENYTGESDVTKVFHGFFVDLISHMPHKLKKMKFRDDILRNLLIGEESSLQVPTVSEYESFLECLGEFYHHDPFQLGRYYFIEKGQYLRLSMLPRMCCLEKLTLFPSAMRFLTGVSSGGSRPLFDLLRQNGHNAALEDFFEMMERYMKNIETSIQLVELNVSGKKRKESQCRIKIQNVHSAVPKTDYPSLVADSVEVRSICNYLRLMESLSARNEYARSFFTSQKPDWVRTLLNVAKLRNFPRILRSAALETCAAMIGDKILSKDVVANIWDAFYSSRLIEPGREDIKEELELEEVRLEEYSLTVGMLRLLRALVKTRFQQIEYISPHSHFVQQIDDNGAFLQYVTYVADTVFLKMPYRSFKNPKQNWTMIQLCSEILSTLLDYSPKLMSQLLCDTPLIRSLLSCVTDCSRATSDVTLHEGIEKCSLTVLQFLWNALQRQQYYLSLKEISHGTRQGIHKIILGMVSAGSSSESLLGIVKFVDCILWSPQHIQVALEILVIIVENNAEIDAALILALKGNSQIANAFRYTLVQLLYQNSEATEEHLKMLEKVKMSALKLIRTSIANGSPGVGFFLLGFDVEKGDYIGVRRMMQALLENAVSVPTSFMTLLSFLSSSHLSQATLALLKSSKFFHGHVWTPGVLEQLSLEELACFLKCLATAIKSEEELGHMAQKMLGLSFERFEDMLNMIMVPEDIAVKVPDLDFFDAPMIHQVIELCEFVDQTSKTTIIRVEKLNGLLRNEINKLQKSTALRLRKTAHGEINHILQYARNLNTNQVQRSHKRLAFDGWRQVVEVLSLSPTLNKKAEFLPNFLRILLDKMPSKSSQQQCDHGFSRLVAETTLTLVAVLSGEVADKSSSEISLGLPEQSWTFVITYLCEWIRSEQNSSVRGILYASLLYSVNLLSEFTSEDTQRAMGKSFFKIIDVLCKDCCQGESERTRMQGLYLMGEIIKCTTPRGLGGRYALKSSTNYRREMDIEENRAGQLAGSEESILDGIGTQRNFCSTRLFSVREGEIGAQAGSYGSTNELGETGDKCVTNVRGGASDYIDPAAIMDSVYSSGILGNLIEALRAVDDYDLIAVINLGTSSENEVNNRSILGPFFVFEAKLTMLTRVAEQGPEAVTHLQGFNLIRTLLDLQVFEILNLHQSKFLPEKQIREKPSDANEKVQVLYSQSRRNHQDKISPDSIYTTRTLGNPELEAEGKSDVSTYRSYLPNFIESLYTLVFQLFLVMVHSAPRNLQLFEQIHQFLDVHDTGVCSLLTPARITNRDSTRQSIVMLTSLITKLARTQQQCLVPISVLKPRLRSALLNILQLHVENNFTRDEVALRAVKNALLYIYYCSNEEEKDRQNKEKAGTSESKAQGACLPLSSLVISNRLQNDKELLRHPDENISIGMIIQSVTKAARGIVNRQRKIKSPKPLSLSPVYQEVPATVRTSTNFLGGNSSLSNTAVVGDDTSIDRWRPPNDLLTVIEVGLTLIVSHVQFILAKCQEKKETKQGNELTVYWEVLTKEVDDNLNHAISQVCYELKNVEYIDTLLLKIRTLTAIHASDEKEGISPVPVP